MRARRQAAATVVADGLAGSGAARLSKRLIMKTRDQRDEPAGSELRQCESRSILEKQRLRWWITCSDVIAWPGL